MLWKLCISNPETFYADATLCELVQRQSSTHRLWIGESFIDVEKMLIPMNITFNHWTLLVLQNIIYHVLPFRCYHSYNIDNVITSSNYKLQVTCTSSKCDLQYVEQYLTIHKSFLLYSLILQKYWLEFILKDFYWLNIKIMRMYSVLNFDLAELVQHCVQWVVYVQ